MSNGLQIRTIATQCRLLVAACLLPLGLASCRVTPESVAHSQAAHDYNRLEIIYRAHLTEGVLLEASQDPSRRGPQLAAVSESGIVPVSAQSVSRAPESAVSTVSAGSELSWSVAELRVQYPHPDKRENYARVTLQLQPVDYGHAFEQHSLRAALVEGVEIRKARRETRRARWFWERPAHGKAGAAVIEFDLPRSDLDELVSELNAHGFFTRERLPHDVLTVDKASQLEVRLDRHWTSRAWSFEPALDALTTQVYEQGRTNSAQDSQPASALDRWAARDWFDTKSFTQFARWR